MIVALWAGPADGEFIDLPDNTFAALTFQETPGIYRRDPSREYRDPEKLHSPGIPVYVWSDPVPA